MLSTRLGYLRPARAARALALDFCAAVNGLCFVPRGAGFFHGGIFDFMIQSPRSTYQYITDLGNGGIDPEVTVFVSLHADSKLLLVFPLLHDVESSAR
jgi:hypothetical protein